MTPINLYQENGSREEISKKSSIFGASFFLGLLLIVATLGAWGVFQYLNGEFVKKNTSLNTDITNRKDELAKNSQVDQVADLQSRISAIKKKLATQTSANEKGILQEVATGVIDGVVVTSYTHKDGTVSLALNCADYATVAKQIAKFRSMKKFSSVAVANLTKGEKGISFEITMVRSMQ